MMLESSRLGIEIGLCCEVCCSIRLVVFLGQRT